MKICLECKENKPISQYSVSHLGTWSSHQRDPILSAYCKECAKVRAREWRRKNKNYQGSGKNSWYPKDEQLLVSMIRSKIGNCKNNSARRRHQIPFTITAKEMYLMWKTQKGLCALSNIEMVLEKRHKYTPSIDRIDPLKGYTLDNVQWVCWAVNRAKGDLTYEEFYIILDEINKKRATTIPRGSTLK